jgi:lipoate-protein ligase A
MAVDAWLLESAVRSGQSAFRWYRWDGPTLSLGYFQDPALRPADPELASLPVVRRLSGGGAIIHDQELTYSLALAPEHPLTADPHALYTLVHTALIDILNQLGVPVRLRGDTAAERAGEFLCFGRGDAFDVVIGSQKVLGSAQRRRKGAVLQHGSLVLRRSSAAPQFPGIYDLARPAIEEESLAELLERAVGRVLSDRVVSEELTAGERQQVQELEKISLGGVGIGADSRG